MAAMTLHILKPSVNNMAVRVFARAAKLDFVEDDAWGKTRSPESCCWACGIMPKNAAPSKVPIA